MELAELYCILDCRLTEYREFAKTTTETKINESL